MNRRNFLVYASATIGCTWVGNSESAVIRKIAIGRADQGPEGESHLLPMFPLAMVAFPGQLVLLHIFEPRYKQLIRDCDQQGISFGISAVADNRHAAYGTEMRLVRILKTYDSGSMDIALKGIRIFRLEKFEKISGKLYAGGLVRFQANNTTIEEDVQSALVELYNQFQTQQNSGKVLTGAIPDNLSFGIGHEVNLSRVQKIQLIAMPNEADRQKFLFRHLEDVRKDLQIEPDNMI
ncbi:LON peptidase substrate-binding domain-containing protein [Pseudomonadota bacterium]